jgi:myosin heavy subunit
MDKKIVDNYQLQVTELREKLESMEEALRKKDEELNNALENERSSGAKINAEKKEFSDLRLKLENQLADAQNLNESLQSELDRVRSEQSNMERELRAQIDELRQDNNTSRKARAASAELERENEDLRNELKEQRDTTEEVRQEAQEFLREMRVLSERTSSSFEREEQLVKEVQRLEEEVKDWRNRYARTKTQLRGLRASSIGLTIKPDAARYARESGFTRDDGLVKDVHVTKFQISIDELLRVARTEDPEKVVDYMKYVVVNVRSITQDIDESRPGNGDLVQQQTKLKSRVSATANNLITASKNFAAAKGLSPVSLLDAAASHLTTAVVELVRTVKIRPTSAGELEDDDGILPPVDTTGFFQARDTRQETQAAALLGLRNDRASAISSVYSPANSPRESTRASRPRSGSKDSWASRRPVSRNGNPPNGMNSVGGANSMNGSKLPPGPIGFGIRTQDADVEELKVSTLSYIGNVTFQLTQHRFTSKIKLPS